MDKEIMLEKKFDEQGISCYQLVGRQFYNAYYIASESETRKLMTTPEIVGYEVYRCMLPATSQMMYYFKEAGLISCANILSILRGALNYPLEEACFQEHIRIHDISFLSSERVFNKEALAGLKIKYSKLAVVPDSTLLIGDIIASGETLIHCIKYVIDFYRENQHALRNIIIFTVGGTKAISILEAMTVKIRNFWPQFEGFICVFHEGIFSTYNDAGITGYNRPDVDFFWKDGIISPEFRRYTLSQREPLLEKCIIYDGGARRYEIHEHIKEVIEYWTNILNHADNISMGAWLEEKLGHKIPLTYEEWVIENHYQLLDQDEIRWLYQQEESYIASMKRESVEEIAEYRLEQFTNALHKYIL